MKEDRCMKKNMKLAASELSCVRTEMPMCEKRKSY